MIVEPTKCGWIVALAALMSLAGVPALAQKKPGGGTGDPCLAAGLDFPAFIYGVTITSSRSTEVEIRVADALGGCYRSLARIPGAERRPLLMALGENAWRAVWPDGDGFSIANDGIVVLDFTVGAQASLTVTGSGRLPSGRTRGLEAAPDGSFLYQKVNSGDVVDSLWRATVSTGTDPAQRIIAAEQLTNAVSCPWFDMAVGPDGDSVYFATERADGQRGNAIQHASLAALTSARDLGQLQCGATILEVVGGNIAQLAAGQCPASTGGNGTCLALERHNVRGIPCTPDYYRTDVFALGTGKSSTLQLAYPSWAAQGALYGRQTGSTSKQSCTAKIYTTTLRHQLNSNLASSSLTTLGTATSIDAPNPMP